MNKRLADKTFPVPKSLHELFGRRTTKAELAIILISCILLSSLLLFHTYDEWSGLAVWQRILLIILALDITGGVVANVTSGTNKYYQTSHKARLVFLAIHVQPLILGWIFGNFALCVILWIFTISVAWMITRIGKKDIQRTAGMASALIGLGILMLFADTHFILNGLLALYVIKLIFSFAVDHEGK